tara:strand:+ start:83257 stop:83784 length:528 start_codon:yes stop_codon:yes gene_type:complete
LIDQATGEALLRLTVRVAVACYLWRTILQVGTRFRRVSRVQFVVWTTGCLFYLLHVGLAFTFVHAWSHQAALEHTAAETARITEIRRGEGLWVNYLFTILWLADVARLGRAVMLDQTTHRTTDLFVAAFFGFIFFNATVVFGPPAYRWIAVPACAAIVFAWYRSRWTSHRNDQSA